MVNVSGNSHFQSEMLIELRISDFTKIKHYFMENCGFKVVRFYTVTETKAKNSRSVGIATGIYSI